jgi:RNA polymerase sigma factor (sigma-70 family)
MEPRRREPAATVTNAELSAVSLSRQTAPGSMLRVCPPGLGHRLAQEHQSAPEGALAEHLETLGRFCRSRTQSAADAEDAVQDTFLRFLQRSDSTDVANMEAWLVRAASRACIDVNRRRGREASLVSKVCGQRSSHNPEEAIFTRAIVAELIRALSPADVWLLVRLYVCDWTPSQVAGAMGVVPGTVRAMAFRARRRAQRALAGLDGPPPRPARVASPSNRSQRRASRAPEHAELRIAV